MVDVRINKAAYDRSISMLQELAKKIDNMVPVWNEFVPYYQTEIMPKVFESKGKIYGQQWAKYSPKYLAWKRKKHAGKPMLVLNGDLKTAATGGSGWFDKRSPKQLKIGVQGKPHFAVQQYGGGNNIPERPYLFSSNGQIPNRAIAELLKMMRNYIKGQGN